MARRGLLPLGWVLLASTAQAQVIERITDAGQGILADTAVRLPSISADGRIVAYDAVPSWYYGTYVPPGAPGVNGVFVHDRQTGVTTLVSVAMNGTPAAKASGAAVSGDGKVVAFASDSGNLVPGDTNSKGDVFVRDLATGAISRVSVATGGGQADGSSTTPAVSSDGRFVAFQSTAANLAPGDTNGVSDVFVRDRLLGTTSRVSVSTGGVQGNSFSGYAAISADGGHVAFMSSASTLVPGDTNSTADVFVHDRSTGATVRASVSGEGSQGNSSTEAGALSSDGHHAVLWSHASNLVPGDTNMSSDVFVRDLWAGTTERVSVDSSGAQQNWYSGWTPSISGNGRWVAFCSWATNLVPGDTNGAYDVFVHDRWNGKTVRVSVGAAGTQGNSMSMGSAISSDGRVVAMWSKASNLVAGDTNSADDIFVAMNPLVPPSPGAANDGPGPDVDQQTAATALAANWSGFQPGTSAIASYEWALGTEPGGTDVQPFVNVGGATSAANASLNPAVGTTYFASVRAVDANGNVSEPAITDGVLVVADDEDEDEDDGDDDEDEDDDNDEGGGGSPACALGSIPAGSPHGLFVAILLTLAVCALRRR